MQSAERGEDALLAPDLILAEAAQVLHKKRLAHLLTGEEVEMLITADSTLQAAADRMGF